jgi:hypothetical protein
MDFTIFTRLYWILIKLRYINKTALLGRAIFNTAKEFGPAGGESELKRSV